MVVFNLIFYLLGKSGLWIWIRIQHLSIWALISPKPNTHEFWASAPPITPQNFDFSLSWKEKKQGFKFYNIKSHDSSIHTCGVDNSRASDLPLTFRDLQSTIKCFRRRAVSHIQRWSVDLTDGLFPEAFGGDNPYSLQLPI